MRVVVRALLQGVDAGMLESHIDEFRRSGEKWEMIELMSKGAHGYSGTLMDEDDVIELYCKVCPPSLP